MEDVLYLMRQRAEEGDKSAFELPLKMSEDIRKEAMRSHIPNNEIADYCRRRDLVKVPDSWIVPDITGGLGCMGCSITL